MDQSMSPHVTRGGHTCRGKSTMRPLYYLYNGPHGKSSFNGTAGQAVVSKTAAYLITDSRYWLQAEDQVDSNWHVIPAGAVDGPKDWIDWLVVCSYFCFFLHCSLYAHLRLN